MSRINPPYGYVSNSWAGAYLISEDQEREQFRKEKARYKAGSAAKDKKSATTGSASSKHSSKESSATLGGSG
ncbi:hypothetical protein PG984_003508 [Apiospora sp. TS-2023a]